MFLGLMLELAAYAAVSMIKRKGLFFDAAGITQSYDDYLRVRDPHLGWKNKGGDAHGARLDPSAYADAAPCVDVFGDSFTRGDEVSDADAWPSVLSGHLKCRVRNFGVGGYGSDQAYLRFRETQEPGKVVLLNHLSENIMRNVNRFRGFLYPSSEFLLKPRFVLEGDGLMLVPLADLPNNAISTFLHDPAPFLPDEHFIPGGPSGNQFARFPHVLRLIGAANHAEIRALATGALRYAQYYAPGHVSQALEITTRILSAFQAEAKAKGLHPVVTIIPTCRDFEYRQANGAFPYAPLAARLAGSGDFVDIGAEMLRLSPTHAPLYNTCSGHMSIAGNALLAQILYARIRAHVPERASGHGGIARQ